MNKISKMFFLTVFVMQTLVSTSQSINNISVSQRQDGSGKVDVNYTLAGDENAYNISAKASLDNANTWQSITNLSGHVYNVSPGNRQLVWNAGTEMPGEYVSNARIKLTATGGGGTENLIAHWNFNEQSGSVLNDVSGNGHTGTISGVTWGNGNLCFDGQNSEVEVPYSSDFSGMNKLTVEAKFKVTSLPAVNDYSRIIAVWDHFNGFNSGTQQAFALSIKQTNNGTMLSFAVRTGSSTSYDGTGVNYTFENFSLNEWIDIVAIADNGHYFLYRNGTLLNDNNMYSNAIVKAAVTPLTIGYSIGTNNENDNVNTHFEGCIDDIKLWNVVKHPILK